jgi:hypothetical protein
MAGLGDDARLQNHCAIKWGTKTVVHKYSDAGVDLLKKVHGAEEYDI